MIIMMSIVITDNEKADNEKADGASAITIVIVTENRNNG
jgi:hypothetical protein